MTRILELATEHATLRIAPALGASITDLMVAGVPVLRPTPDAALTERNVRLTGCYPLVPYSNRIRDATLRFGGREFALARNFGTHPHAIHGVGWQREWVVDDVAADHARLSLDHAAMGEDAAAWPWPFRATESFRLTELAGEREATGVLVVSLTLRNVGVEAFPFGLGFHPFFHRDATTRLGFVARRVWRNDATQLPQALVDLPPEWQFDPPTALDSMALDNVFTGWRGEATLVDAIAGTSFAMSADRACGYVVVYAPPAADFVAVEPVSHETDAFNRAAAGANETGMRVLPPGAAFSCTMRVAFGRRRPARPERP